MRIKIDHKLGTYRLEIQETYGRHSYLMEPGVSIVVEVSSVPLHLHAYQRNGSLEFSVLEEVDAAPVVEVAAAPEPAPEAQPKVSSDGPSKAPTGESKEVKSTKRTKRKSGDSKNEE